MLCIRKGGQGTKRKPSTGTETSLVVTELLCEVTYKLKPDGWVGISLWMNEGMLGWRGLGPRDMTNDYTATVCEAGGAMGVPGFRGNNQPSKTQNIGTDSYLQKKKKGLRYPWRLEFTLEVPCTVSPHYIWQLTWTVIPKWKLNFEIHVHCTCALNLWTPALFYVIQVLSHFLSPFIHYSSLTYKSDAFGYWKEMHFWNQIFLHIKIAFESDISFL